MENKPITNPKARFWGYIAAVIFVIAGFLFAPYIWVAIGGMVGLICAAIIAIATWFIRPYVFTVAANMRLALIKAAARQNPCETLEEDLRRQMVELENRREAVNRLKAQVMNLTDKLGDYAAKWGTKGADYIKLLGARDNLAKLHQHRLEKWDAAHMELGRWAQEIERAKDIWAAACAAADAQEASGLSEDEFFAKLKTDTALETIKTSFNTQLASLDTELAQSDNPPIMG